ncbi:MAG: R3H domain-containing nucleic acid-binding protein [Patescibacteria group bacterium]
MEEKIQTIKEVIEDLLSKLTIDAKIDVLETANGPQFIIKTHEGGLVIGENGKNLVSLNHLVKKIINKKIEKTEDFFQFSLDVNDYQAKKIEDLKNTARLNAQRVRYFKKEVVLRSMTAFERRIVHMTLEDCPDITTDSKGEEPQRQVIIKPLDF